MATTAPFLLKDITLTLKKVGSAGPAVDYRCQLNQAQITPSTGGGGGGQTYETFCETFSSGAGTASTFTLDLSGFQAYSDVADLSVLLWEDAGEEYDFVLTPLGGTISATNPGFSGTVTLVEGAVGGTANTYAAFTVSLPCKSKPSMIVTPPVATFGADEDENADEFVAA